MTDKNPTHHIALHSITDLKSLQAVTRAMKKLYPDLKGVTLPSNLFQRIFSHGCYDKAFVDSCIIWQDPGLCLNYKIHHKSHPAYNNVQKWIKDHPEITCTEAPTSK